MKVSEQSLDQSLTMQRSLNIKPELESKSDKELKEKLIQGIEKQNISMTELKAKRDDSLIKILKTKKANGL